MSAKRNPEAAHLGVHDTDPTIKAINAVPSLSLTTDEAASLTEEIRSRLNALADNTEAVLDLIAQAKAGDAHVALGFASWTAYVAAEFGEALGRLTRGERRPVAELLSSEGMSTRAIGRVLGVSNATVSRDLAGVTDVTGEVVGIDGRTYPRANQMSAACERYFTARVMAEVDTVLQQLGQTGDRSTRLFQVPPTVEEAAAYLNQVDEEQNALKEIADAFGEYLDFADANGPWTEDCNPALEAAAERCCGRLRGAARLGKQLDDARQHEAQGAFDAYMDCKEKPSPTWEDNAATLRALDRWCDAMVAVGFDDPRGESSW